MHTQLMRSSILVAAAFLLVGCGSTGSPYGGTPTTSPTSTGAASLGSYNGHLTGAGGRALYLWVADKTTTSTCSGACATAWPPFTATSAPMVSAPLVQSKVGLAARPDGRTQVTYAGHPLYYFASDHDPSDTYGQGNNGFGAAWWLVSPSGASVMSTSSGAGGY